MVYNFSGKETGKMDKVINTIIFCGVVMLLLFVVNFVFNKILKWSNNIHLKFLKSFVDVIVVLIFSYAYLSQFEVTKDISKTLMQSGTLIIALVSFTAQRVLANVISGIAVSVSKPFDIGDKVRVISSNGNIISEGIILDINLRHTVIKKYDGQCDIVPNSIMDSSVISNTNLIENVGNFVEISISYDSNLDLACKLLKKVVVDNELTLNTDEDTSIVVKDLVSSGVLLRVLVTSGTLDDSFEACSNIRKQILKVFEKSNIKLAY